MKRAFTILEVLVVIAIISILTAITMSIYGGVRARALQAGCGSNVRQISQALLLYADSHEGRLGGGIERLETWLEATEIPNVGDIGKCPAFSFDNDGRPDPSPNLQGYALNSCLARKL